MKKMNDTAGILIVEDHPHNVAVLDSALSAVGLKADTAIDGRQALERLASTAYGLVLLDYHLPYFDGADIMRWMNATLEPRPAVIVITADIRSETATLFETLGCDAFTTKPVDVPELLDLVGALLAEGSRRGGGLGVR